MDDITIPARFLLEYVESSLDCAEALFDSYIEEKRYEYRSEWFAFLEKLDKE